MQIEKTQPNMDLKANLEIRLVDGRFPKGGFAMLAMDLSMDIASIAS